MQSLEFAICVLALIIVVAIIAIYKRRNPSEADKEWASKFLDSLSEHIYKEVLEIISTTDFTQFSTVTEANNYLVELIYGTVWTFVEQKLAEASETGVMPKLAAKIITKTYVETFVKTILEKMDFDSKVETAYHSPTDFDVEQAIEEDVRLGKEFENENEYFENGEVKQEDLPKTEEVEKEPTEDASFIDPVAKAENPDIAPQEIIPPSEEDEIPISEDDDTVEVIGDDGLTDAEREAGIHFNKAGRKVDKRGRFVKR